MNPVFSFKFQIPMFNFLFLRWLFWTRMVPWYLANTQLCQRSQWWSSLSYWSHGENADAKKASIFCKLFTLIPFSKGQIILEHFFFPWLAPQLNKWVSSVLHIYYFLSIFLKAKFFHELIVLPEQLLVSDGMLWD